MKWTRSHGYPEDLPAAKSRFSMIAQYAQLGICLPIGLLALWGLLRGLRRRIEMDDQGLSTNWGLTVPFAGITELNKERWRSKGIAIVHFSNGGRPRRMVLDDWKFQQQPIGQMVKTIEEHLKPEQITGDIKPVEAQPQQNPPAQSAGKEGAE